MRVIDITGQKFGRLTVLYRINRPAHIKSKNAWYRCLCDCGNYKDVCSKHLRSGAVKSCGCYNVEHATKHGLSRTRLYRIWALMKDRCTNVNCPTYSCYGGRGITFCDEWKSFENFHDWAINNGYKDLLTIDRIDVNGNYEPSNCRWSTMKEQGRNRRNNRNITINGKTMCLSEWCEIYGIDFYTVMSRLKRGWDYEKAITTPIRWVGPRRKKEREAS